MRWVRAGSRRLATVAFIAIAITVCVAACQPAGTGAPATPAHPSTTTRPTSSPIPPPVATNTRSAQPAVAGAGTALAALSALPVKGRAPMTGYDRSSFGPAWADVDHNGCDTRNDILRRDLTGKTLKADTSGCLVLTGTLNDPYTGHPIHFVRGVGTSTAVQIDHVVALGDAWQTGAQGWGPAKREAFANDPLELLAVDGPQNEAKGDADAASWLPPSHSYRCAYVARQEAVKEKYGLWATAAEKAAITRVLTACPTQRMPTAKPIPLGGGRIAMTSSAPVSSAKPKPAPTSSAPQGATAICRDGTFSFSQHHAGTCSHHGGVLKWL